MIELGLQRHRPFGLEIEMLLQLFDVNLGPGDALLELERFGVFRSL